RDERGVAAVATTAGRSPHGDRRWGASLAGVSSSLAEAMATYVDSSAAALVADRPNIFAAPVDRGEPNGDKSEGALARRVFDAGVDSRAEPLPSVAAEGSRVAGLLRQRCRRLAARLSARSGARVVGLAAAVAVPAVLA